MSSFVLPATPRHHGADDDRVAYFGYGSNLSTRYVREYTPGAETLVRAVLPNYRIEFRRYSENLAGGISSIIEAPGHLVRGVLYSVPVSELEALDILEDVPEGIYRRETFLVLDERGEWRAADLYRVASPAGPFVPSAAYVDMMLEGAREHALDPDYVAELTRLRAAIDSA